MSDYENAAIPSLPTLLLRPIVEAALREDIRSGDITTAALIPSSASARARMVFRQAGIVSGVDVARLTFQLLDSDVSLEASHSDGAAIEAGQTILLVEGTAAAILTAERVALNFVQRLSGIATLTRQFVDAVQGTNAHIADIRKTTPGLRLLEKYAVRCGGGANHRFALDDLILIKDNHIALCGGITTAVQRARRYAGHALKIEVECDTLEQVAEAITTDCDIILLDNMAPHDLHSAVVLVREASGKKILTEASGGINLQTARAVAESGVDLLSVGALTHSAGALDVGLDIEITQQ